MNFDKDFYEKWKAKSLNKQQLFLEETKTSKIETDKIFSSTAMEEQTESQFSLRLSESYVDETQESLHPQLKSKPNPEDIVLISDSNSDDSILPLSRTGDLLRSVRTQRARRIIESSDEEVVQIPVNTPRTVYTSTKQFVVEESDCDESDPSEMQKILKETVTESMILSERKKKEILNWLTNNFDNMKCTGDGAGSSYSQDSVVCDSRKSTICSSGNSSLERLEMNFETPNNRGKVTRLITTDKKLSKEAEKENERQSRLDKYFKKSTMEQLNIVRDRTPGSKSFDKTPTNISKPNKREIRNLTPVSSNSNKTLTNHVKSCIKKLNKNKIPLSENSESPVNFTRSHIKKNIRDSKTLTYNNERKISADSSISNPKDTIPITQSSELVEDSEDMPIQNIEKNEIIPESDSFETKESIDIFEKLSNDKSKESLELLEKLHDNENIKKNLNIIQNLNDLNINRKSCDSENVQKQSKILSEDLEITDDIDTSSKSNLSIESEKNQMYRPPKINVLIDNQKNGADIFEKSIHLNFKYRSNTNDQFKKTPEFVPEIWEITDDINHSDNSPEQNSKNQRGELQKQQLNHTSIHNKTVNTTINDCADILESLYGEAWRNKAKTLVSTTKPKRQTKIMVKDNDCNTRSKSNETKFKKYKNKNTPKDSFINDNSTTESSPDCSYYTALSNPIPSQKHLPTSKTTSTVKVNENYKNDLLAICDSESDVDNINENWKIRGPRKLSFDSSSSSITSEFDPDDIIPPKIKAKTIKIKKLINSETIQTKNLKKPCVKKSFLASLSKEVPPHQADFNAMTYRNKYSTLKENLSKVLFKLFNEKVFNNKLPENMPLEWSVRLRGTAGQCHNKQSVKALGKTVRSCKISLATKILDSPERLRDTLIHEMCHAATWLINNVSDGHGRFWKAWAHKAMTVFPELPPITRCHNYEIQTKYTYKCVSCGYSIGRHSKSLNLDIKRCGYCCGKFECLINKVTKNGQMQKKSLHQTKTPTGFALYVKENYQLVKQSEGITKHGDIMKILGQQFSAIKLTSKPGNNCRNNDNDES